MDSKLQLMETGVVCKVMIHKKEIQDSMLNKMHIITLAESNCYRQSRKFKDQGISKPRFIKDEKHAWKTSYIQR